MDVSLRELQQTDLPLFFEFQRDPDANLMAAFTAPDPEDRAAFDREWQSILGDSQRLIRTIVVEDENGPGSLRSSRPGGYVMSFTDEAGRRQVSYWIDPTLWGRGVVSKALAEFLTLETRRPLHARVVSDNAASLRALSRCGFDRTGTETAFANARGAEAEATLLRLA